MPNPKVSSIEFIVAEELDQRGLLYDHQVRVGRFIPDFIVGDTILEVDGDYWHNRPGIPERDAMKDAFYADAGFKVIRIWQHEIKASDFSKLAALTSI